MTVVQDEPTLGALEARARQRTGDFGEHALIVCDSLVRIYQSEGVEVQALQGLDLLVEEGELLAIVGASGSGKSTLLSVLSGLDVPTAGKVRVGPWDLMAMSSKQRVEYRRSMVGFVWQQTARNVVPYLNATENVAFPLALAAVLAGSPVSRSRPSAPVSTHGTAMPIAVPARTAETASGASSPNVIARAVRASRPSVRSADSVRLRSRLVATTVSTSASAA